MSEYLYGRQCVREALRAGRRAVHSVLMAEGLWPAPILRDIATLARERGVALTEARRERLSGLAEPHQGVVAEVGPYPYVGFEESLERLAERSGALVLALDCLQDPQNFGSLLRTAEAVQVDLVVIQDRRQVPVTPAVSHVSAGAAEHLKVAVVVNLRRALQQMRECGLFVFGLERAPGSHAYYRCDLRGPSVIVVGSEGQGLRRLTREACDMLLELPMLGNVASLNASVAGSVLLYEAVRQRQAARA